MSRGPQSRVWDFTLNNPEMSGRELYETLHAQTQYFQFQPEIAPTTSTRHFQGYVIFQTRARVSALLKLIPKASFRPMKTDTKALDDYTSKEESREPGGQVYRGGAWEYITRQGGQKQAGNKLKIMLEGVVTKQASVKEAFGDSMDVYTRNYRGIAATIAVFTPGRPRRGWEVENALFYGPPGSGKSTFAQFINYDIIEYRHSATGKEVWFDGYQNETKVIFEDFKAGISGWKKDLFCAVADRFPTRVPVKGGFLPWNTKLNYFTSNIHPQEWWSYASQTLFYEIERRFKRVYAWRGLRDGPYVLEPGSDSWKSFWKGPLIPSGTTVTEVRKCENPRLRELKMCDCPMCRLGQSPGVTVTEVSSDRWTFWLGHLDCVKLNYDEYLKKAESIDAKALEDEKEKKVIETAEMRAEKVTKVALEKQMNERPHIDLPAIAQGKKRAREDDPPMDLEVESPPPRPQKMRRYRSAPPESMWDTSVTPHYQDEESEEGNPWIQAEASEDM